MIPYGVKMKMKPIGSNYSLGKICVLCQQNLSPEAASRLRGSTRFFTTQQSKMRDPAWLHFVRFREYSSLFAGLAC
jgi:hypothetical protein